MEDRSFLHDGERLLCSVCPSISVLLSRLLGRTLIEGGVVGIVLALTISLVQLLEEFRPSLLSFVVILLGSYALLAFQQWRGWRRSRLRVTSERILLEDPPTLTVHPFISIRWVHRRRDRLEEAVQFVREPTITIKWPQYQESHVGLRGFWDFLFRARPISVRYGTADAEREACFPALAWASDLKHYLDKVDSAVRNRTIEGLRPFIEKRRGRRD
jgi:hypothetical protein